MRILITSGGTREPIDDVRYVGNVATGSTGARLAAEAVRRFHTVYLLSGTGSAEPPAWALETGLLVRRTYGSTMDLMAAADEILDLGVDAIIASAAVADFSPVPESGKITSQLDELVIRMRPTPKVIDHMRRRAPEALLVAFKLESGIPRAQLFERARRTLERSGADLIVANELSGIGEDRHPATILGKGGLEEPVSTRAELAERLLDLIEERRTS